MVEKIVTEDLIRLSKKMTSFVVGMEGNVSGKITDDIFLIKASGAKLENLTREGLVICDSNCSSLEEEKKPSMEVHFHSILLSLRNIKYVCHTHPTNTVKILCSKNINLFAEKRLFPDQVIFNGTKSCVVDYFHPGLELSNEIKKSVEIFFEENKVLPKLILLKNHGIITIGSTVEECIVSTEICEKSAEIFLGSLNGQNFLTDKDISKLVGDENEKFREKKLKN